MFNLYDNFLEKCFGIKFEQLNPAVYAQIDQLKKKEEALTMNKVKANANDIKANAAYLDAVEKIELQQQKLYSIYLKALPDTLRSTLYFFGEHSNKFAITHIKVEAEKETTEVRDFGLTYF